MMLVSYKKRSIPTLVLDKLMEICKKSWWLPLLFTLGKRGFPDVYHQIGLFLYLCFLQNGKMLALVLEKLKDIQDLNFRFVILVKYSFGYVLTLGLYKNTSPWAFAKSTYSHFIFEVIYHFSLDIQPLTQILNW